MAAHACDHSTWEIDRNQWMWSPRPAELQSEFEPGLYETFSENKTKTSKTSKQSIEKPLVVYHVWKRYSK